MKHSSARWFPGRFAPQALLAGVLLLLLALPPAAAGAKRGKCAAPPCPKLEDPAYEDFYYGNKGRYMQHEEWIKMTREGTTWPKAGEVVHTLKVQVRTDRRVRVEFGRKMAKDGEKVGLSYDVIPVSRTRNSFAITRHIQGDIEPHRAAMRPERVDPNEYLTSRAYGSERANYGEYVNKRYDAAVRGQASTSDPKKRRAWVNQAQQLLAEDLYIGLWAWGPALVEPYNHAKWDGIRAVRAFGVGSPSLVWNYIEATPKTAQRRLNVVALTLLRNPNPFSTSGLDRGVMRMIFDSLGYMDRDLKKIHPWAAESWRTVDAKTYDVTLRGGMKWHDGRPVTVDDVKFTFDFMLQHDRGVYWVANRNLKSVEIVDPAKRIVRFHFKRPYGQFETHFLILNRILPKHIWQDIMKSNPEKGDPRMLLLKNEQIIGSGPFKWTGFYKKDTELLLAANKEHHHAPKVDEVLFVVVPSIDGVLGRFETGEADLGVDAFLTPSQEAQLKGLPHIKVVRSPDVNWVYGLTMISRLPWRDIEFRRAWMHALDRNYVVNVVMEGYGRLPTSNTFLPEGHPFHNPNLPPIQEFNLDKARQILKDAGYSWNSEGRLVYPPPTDKEFIRRVNQVTRHAGDWGGIKMQTPQP